MKMTPALLVIGSLLVFWTAIFIMVILPVRCMQDPASEIWRPWTAEETAGHALYVANGCSYCHSLYIRSNDWDLGADRLAQRGDYVGQEPAILGTERTGPDLSEDGGEHPDDWHQAHFTNPRNTRPQSLMPSWQFLGEDDLRKLTAFVQAQGGKNADVRVQRQLGWKALAVRAYRLGIDGNIRWLHDQIPATWRPMPNPYPATEAALLRGKKVYEDQCMSCHGQMGDGQGDAAAFLMPPPLNFTELRGRLVEGRYIGGIFYYQVMNGITGTAMPYFKRDLESEKIWDVSNYLAVYYLGYTDAGIAPKGIDASYEPNWPNPYAVPPQVETQP
jgi:cytochrome c oxidase cbb3-type subunit II